MAQLFEAGDDLIFQVESGYGLMRVLAIDEAEGKVTWHTLVYEDLFMDVEKAETALANAGSMRISYQHLPLTNRAFESTQVAKISNRALTESEMAAVNAWRENPSREAIDRSVRLMLGLR
jgi:hypothetical protein